MSNSRTNVELLKNLLLSLGSSSTSEITTLLGLLDSGNAGIINAGGLRLNNVAVADDQTIDYYKKGASWTPVLQFGGASTGVTYSAQTGRYVRIADLLYVSCSVTLTSKGSATGLATVTGLPFGVWPANCVMRGGNFSTLTGLPGAVLSGTVVALVQGAATGDTGLLDTNFANNTNFHFSGIGEIV